MVELGKDDKRKFKGIINTINVRNNKLGIVFRLAGRLALNK